jgi:hypothetical protein
MESSILAYTCTCIHTYIKYICTLGICTGCMHAHILGVYICMHLSYAIEVALGTHTYTCDITHVYIHIYIHIHTRIHTHLSYSIKMALRTHTYTSDITQVYIHTYTCTHIHTLVMLSKWLRGCIHMTLHTYSHIHTHIHTLVMLSKWLRGGLYIWHFLQTRKLLREGDAATVECHLAGTVPGSRSMHLCM